MARLIVSVVVGAEPHLVLGCLASLGAASGAHDVEIRVICNTPDAKLATELARRFPGIKVAQNEVPRGFATNHNRALEAADAAYFLIANDDLVFDPGSVARSIEFLERPENARVAALPPKVLNPDRSVQRSTYRFPSVPRALLDLSGIRDRTPHNRWTDRLAGYLRRGAGRSRFWPHDHTCDVETFRGAAMFVRAAAWREVGPLSELTCVGGEIAEWHRRCRGNGWRVVFFADASVVHYRSRTVGRDPLLASEYLKGYLFYFSRHRGPGISLCFRAGAIPIAGMRLALAGLARDRVATQLWRTNLSLLLRPLAAGRAP